MNEAKLLERLQQLNNMLQQTIINHQSVLGQIEEVKFWYNEFQKVKTEVIADVEAENGQAEPANDTAS